MTARTYLQTKLDIAELDGFLRAAEPSQGYPRRTDLFSEGGKPQTVFVLSQGLVKLTRSGGDGRSAVVGLRSRGWILGAGAALQEEPFTITATTVTRSQVYRIPATVFRAQVRKNDVLSWYLHRMHVEEIARGITHAVGLSCLSAKQRLETFFEEIAAELPSTNHEIEIPLRDWEIAQLISITPPYLSRLVQEMIGEGRLHREHGRLLAPSGKGTEVAARGAEL